MIPRLNIFAITLAVAIAANFAGASGADAFAFGDLIRELSGTDLGSGR